MLRCDMSAPQSALEIARPNGGWIEISWSPLVKALLFTCGLALGGLLQACAGSPPPHSAASRPVTPERVHLPGGVGSRVRSHSLDFPVELALPSKASWQISDGPLWLVLDHGLSGSRLALRSWRAERLVRRDDCEAQARLERLSLPVVHEEAVVDRRQFPAPADFDTQLVVGVEPTAQGIFGYAIAIGASVGRCYAAVFTTRVDGAQAEDEVAARLGIAVDRLLSSVRLLGVEARAVRRRLVVTPAARATPE